MRIGELPDQVGGPHQASIIGGVVVILIIGVLPAGEHPPEHGAVLCYPMTEELQALRQTYDELRQFIYIHIFRRLWT
jgi:hypothetical protein